MSDGTPFLKLEQQMGEGKGIKTRESGLSVVVWLWECTCDHACKKVRFQRIMQTTVPHSSPESDVRNWWGIFYQFNCHGLICALIVPPPR